MTRQELSDAVAAYLDQHDENYDNFFKELSKTVYDELERKKAAEKKRKEGIVEQRAILVEAILAYVEILLEEELEEDEYDVDWRSLYQLLEKEVEPAILKLKKFNNSIKSEDNDKDLLLKYVKGLI